MFTHAPRVRRRHEEVGLARQESRNLQHVADLAHRLALFGRVDVREDGDVELRLDFVEHRQGAVEPDAAPAFAAGAVRLVEARLEDVADAEVARDPLHPLRDHHRMIAAFHLAGAGDQREGRALRELGAPKSDRGIRSGHGRPFDGTQSSRERSIAAAMKEAKSGCGSKGRDFSSG